MKTLSISKLALAATLATTLVGTSAWARTNVDASIDQLKVNADNSEFNYKQYQDNLDVVNGNVSQSDKAVKELKQLQTQLINNTKNVDKNKQALGEMEKEIAALKLKEQAKITQEEKQILEMRTLLDKLEANKKKREENLAAYDTMTMQVQQERQDWDTQVQQMGVLQKELQTKQKKAEDEKLAWEGKRRDYEAEAKKWDEQSKKSRDSYAKLKKMNE